jgi:hypothetical protein
MFRSRGAIGLIAMFTAILLLTNHAIPVSHAQDAADTIVRSRFTVSDSDIEAAANVRFSSFHVMAANVPGARERAATLNRESARRVAELEGREIEPEATRPEQSLTSPYFYPGDLTRVNAKAPTVAASVSHAVYIDYKGSVASNWGNPEGFLSDLFKDKFIHVTDQYTGSTADNYTVGAHTAFTYNLYGGSNVLYEHELWAIVHSVASRKGFGTGTGHIYHLFLPRGIDTCMDETAECYSPDNPGLWVFCAYHDAVTFSDIGTVLFTVVPYLAVDGCAVEKPYANSELIDSTNSALSHETFETITDPIPNTAWINETTFPEAGNEVADECQPPQDENYNFKVPIFKISGKKYEVQLEYSNLYHACVTQP